MTKIIYKGIINKWAVSSYISFWAAFFIGLDIYIITGFFVVVCFTVATSIMQAREEELKRTIKNDKKND